jgi:hypothetical protein
MIMRARRTSCLRCGLPTCRDPGYDGVKSGEPYCVACDAVWHRVSCVVCGESYLVDVTRHRGGHHCDPIEEDRIEADRKREAVLAQVHHTSVGQRLHRGFRMWHEEER